jgi:hypothetical protein
MKNLLPQSDQSLGQQQLTSRRDLSQSESYLHQMTNDLTMSEEKPQDPEGEAEDQEDEGEEESQLNGEEEEDNKEEESEDDDDSDEDTLSSIGTITEWSDRLRFERMRTARDFLLYAFECLVSICENRLELQDRIANSSPFFFQALYGAHFIVFHGSPSLH